MIDARAPLRILFPSVCIDGLYDEDGGCMERATTLRWRGGWEPACREHGGLVLTA